MQRHIRLVTCLALLALPMAASAVNPEETTSYSPDSGERLDKAGLEASIATIKECLRENKANKIDAENCIGITKAFCSLSVPTCNHQEASAWDTLAIRAKPSLRKSQKAWVKRVKGSCRSGKSSEGYDSIVPGDPWDAHLIPSGCALEVSARRYLRMKRK